MHFRYFLAVFELLSDSLTAIYVELHQCPSHHSILLTQGPIWEIFTKKFWDLAILKNVVFLSRPFWFFFFYIYIPMSTSQSLLVSKDGSKFWSSQTWQHFLTQPNILTGSVCILTCCIIFKFESSFIFRSIRKKTNEEVVTWRGLIRWQRITTKWISQYWWCDWITIINCQCICPEKDMLVRYKFYHY